MKKSDVMSPKLTGKVAASKPFTTDTGEAVYLTTKTSDRNLQNTGFSLESIDLRKAMITVSNQLHSNYRNFCCNFMARTVSEVLQCINNSGISETDYFIPGVWHFYTC